MIAEQYQAARELVSRWERDPVCPSPEDLAIALRQALDAVEGLQGALKGARCKANVMTFLWRAAEEEMRSDDPVEIRLRKDLEDADQHAQKLAARVAELEARICDVAKWKAANDARAAELSFLDDPEDWAPCVGSVADLAEIIDLAAVEVRE